MGKNSRVVKDKGRRKGLLLALGGVRSRMTLAYTSKMRVVFVYVDVQVDVDTDVIYVCMYMQNVHKYVCIFNV